MKESETQKLAPGELLIGDDFGVFFLFDRVIGEPGLLLGSSVGVSQGGMPLVGVMEERGRFSFIFSGVIVGRVQGWAFCTCVDLFCC